MYMRQNIIVLFGYGGLVDVHDKTSSLSYIDPLIFAIYLQLTCYNLSEHNIISAHCEFSLVKVSLPFSLYV